MRKNNWLAICIILAVAAGATALILYRRSAGRHATLDQPNGDPGTVEVARVNAFTGAVSVARGEDGSTVTLAQTGGTILDDRLFNRDEVRTGEASSCDVLYADGSIVKIAEKSRVVVDEVVLATSRVEEEGGKGIGRKVRILIGDIWSNVNPNRLVLTEFETPFGVAAVKGTVLQCRVDGTRSAFAVDSGLVHIKSHDQSLGCDVPTGGHISFAQDPVTHDQRIENLSKDVGLTVSVGDIKADMPARSAARIAPQSAGDTSRFNLAVEAGQVTVIAPAGEQIAVSAGSATDLAVAKDGSVTVSPTEGTVEVKEKPDATAKELKPGETEKTQAKETEDAKKHEASPLGPR